MKEFFRRIFTRVFRIGYSVPFRGRVLKFDVPVKNYYEIGDLLVVELDWTYMDYANAPLYEWKNDPRKAQNISAFNEDGKEIWRIRDSHIQLEERDYVFFNLVKTKNFVKSTASYNNLAWDDVEKRLVVYVSGYECVIDPCTGEIMEIYLLPGYGSFPQFEYLHSEKIPVSGF